MRIGLDGMPLNQQLTGVGHYTLELVRAMAQAAPHDEFEIVSPFSYIFEEFEGRDGLPANVALARARTSIMTRRWWSIGLPRHLEKEPVDLFHGTNFEVPLWAKPKCPTVLTVHDLSQLLYPDTHEARDVRRARRRLPLMARAATMIITPSESVRNEVCGHLKIARDKVVVVSEAAREVFRPMSSEKATKIRTQLSISDEFVLFVGTIEPRKDLQTLLRAFARVAHSRNSLQLVVTGKMGWMFEDWLKQLRNSKVRDRVKLTGYLNDEELRALYSSCRAFVYPSIYEGFGLPPLEAMACGAPVISSRIDSIEEVCGDAALLIDPRSVGSFAGAMDRVLDDQSFRTQLSIAGSVRASEFSWNRTAELTRAVYQEAIERFRLKHE